MSTTGPRVSVVTAVHDGSEYLSESLRSILAQEGLDFEFIVVNDGSNDVTRMLLQEFSSQDGRLRLFHQPHLGLTQALIRGCAESRGEYIARHDADDVSLPGRLKEQLVLMDADPTLSMATCWSHAIGPGGETLFDFAGATCPKQGTEDLVTRRAGHPPHGSLLWRTAAYHRVGGYRRQFRFAQDWDLALRLTETGWIGFVPRFLYAFRVRPSSISAQRREQQSRSAALAHLCRQARLRGESEHPFLDEATAISREAGAGPAFEDDADSNYFIGKCLSDRRDQRAWKYLWRSVRQRPWQVRGWAGLAAAGLRLRRST